MPGVPEPAVRELALNPDLEELALQQIADANRDFGDGVDASSIRGRRGGGLLERRGHPIGLCGDYFGWRSALLVRRPDLQVGRLVDLWLLVLEGQVKEI